MIKINEHYLKLKSSYLFADIAKRIDRFQKDNPDKEIIKLGIGDVTLPLPLACLKAMHKAVDEMGVSESFKGYGPEQGYGFLREIIAQNDYQSRGARIDSDELFISDGAKCDTGNIQEIFDTNVVVAVPDPVYPVYVDTNVMAGRTGTFSNGRYQKLVYLESTRDNNFIPDLPQSPVDLIYLCYPNNPTGATITKDELAKWVAFAKDNKALILFDAAYEAFIRDPELPKSIYEIDGADEVAIEFRSFSKTAGFTGTRCAFTVVPKKCRGYNAQGQEVELHALWNRRQSTKFNGVSYPVQKAAEAVYSDEGQKQVRSSIDYYLTNAGIIKEKMQKLGFECTGGENSPYIWIDGKKDSWSFFDDLLNKAGIVCTPGDGFGLCGKGYIRISAFNSLENVEKAMERIEKAL
ncbi:LL-diaminopimelate aminotransferase [Desulfonatronovibrio magnus]|uniref:LL-diaminopimelate aminotransferase n=1 Tax=Desulfonatronovibrio magnus TaxID=698827 RepID=UPI0005EACEB9|nr:LL-diaminopimelate aminotransferase [Desulfonatronovibrio magnus]